MMQEKIENIHLNQKSRNQFHVINQFSRHKSVCVSGLRTHALKVRFKKNCTKLSQSLICSQASYFHRRDNTVYHLIGNVLRFKMRLQQWSIVVSRSKNVLFSTLFSIKSHWITSISFTRVNDHELCVDYENWLLDTMPSLVQVLFLHFAQKTTPSDLMLGSNYSAQVQLRLEQQPHLPSCLKPNSNYYLVNSPQHVR